MESFNQNVIRHKAGLLNLAAELGNISKACRMMGFSRDTFYRYQTARDAGGVEALFEVSRKKPNLKNRGEEATEQAVIEFAIEYPAHGQVRASNDLRKSGVFVSPSGVRSIWLRHGLSSMKQRLRALEKKSAEEGLVLTEVQIQALESKRQDDEACSEIESHHPGYLGSQDTFYVGTIKGVGRIYQQTFVDTYSKWAAAKLYTTKTPITGADRLNDRVLPFFASQEMGILRILTDRGTEYCDKLETHDYQFYLGVTGIEHTRTKTRHPQTNGICERFHKTILHGFYQVAFRRKLYHSLEELQADLDTWTGHYNSERTHQGKMCCGRTPMQTLLDGKTIWEEKVGQLN